MSEALKLCPFCGGEPSLNKNVVSIHCPSCCGNGIDASVTVRRKLGSGDMEKCVAEAIVAWNRRTPATLPTVEELEAIYNDGVKAEMRQSVEIQRRAGFKHLLAELTRRMGGES